MGTEFTKLRNSDPKYAWLQAYSMTEVRYVLKYLADAYQAFFAGGGRPCFKSKHHTRDGFTIAQKVKIAQGRLHVPKIGKLQLKGANPYAHCQPKQARVCKEGTATRPKWYVYITYEVPVAEVKPGAETGALGLDRNVGQAMDSQGQLYRMTDTKRLDAKIKRKQRVKERKQKGSKRGRRVAGQLRKLQRKRKRIRDNDTHHISRELADKAHTVVLEDLNTAGMTISAKGTVKEPGSNVKQKAGLNREILATGWHQLERRLMYKCGSVVKVDPKHTSQTCHQCGCVDKRNRVSQAIFQCVGCGLRMHADHNAAINILVRHARTVAQGTGATARRVASSLEAIMTREQDILQLTC